MVSLDEIFKPEMLTAHYDKISNVRLSNGLRMEYAVHGDDDAEEKVLMIMGFQGDKEAWLPFMSTFRHPTHGPSSQYQFVTFDNRGVGGTDSPWGFYSTSQMAADAILLMNHLKWDRAHIVGSRYVSGQHSGLINI
jgi:pimeloyl-ACP methyl ester carboxylesterase